MLAEIPPQVVDEQTLLSFVAAVCNRLASADRDGAPTFEELVAAIETEKARR